MTDRVFNDPFGVETAKYRRNVLAISSFIILVEAYNITLKETPYISFDTSQASPDFLKGILATILLYHFFAFLSYALVELRRWYQANNILLSGEYFYKISSIRDFFSTLDTNFEKIKNHELRSDLHETMENGISNINQMEPEILKIHQKHTNTEAIQWIRIGVFDVGITVAVGSYALFLVCKHLPSFLSYVF